MKKVLFLVNHDYTVYNTRLEIVERLLKEGYQVHISSPDGVRIPELVALGCHFHEISINRHGMNPVEEIKLIRTYKNLFKTVAPDVILGFTIKPNIYGSIAAKNLKIPFVANITGLGTAVEYKSWKQPIFINLYKYAFKGIYKVYFQNTANRDFFLNHNILKDHYSLIPGSGVNLNRFSEKKYPENSIVKFAFISRVMQEKGIDQFIDTATFIREKYPNTEFNIYGFCEQAYEEKLKKLQEQGIVIFHGMIKDIAGALESTSCLLHPSYYPEGLSNVLLEASAIGRPIITTNRPGCREVIDDGMNGYLVEQKNSQDLIEKVEKFLNLTQEEKIELGHNARAKVEKEFDRQIIVEQYMKDIVTIGGKKQK
ncbi:glycosyltransferase family 4 protein [Streptococcus uberis]|uniref:glycosyltransferase family 4 protein n=1 Tax=Streptococcus uberis TaxID=1349 RepID=UPI0020BE9496|nr:glycosyltransferase family 4 protein [Streptococcus uberis]MCK1192660.1 glycosyltransferase family 4 protein [Streptococcus uberis]